MNQDESGVNEFRISLFSSAIGGKISEDDNMEIDKQEIKFGRILAAITIIGVAFIVAAHFLPPIWLLLRGLAQSVGEALIVAAILGFTVDRYMKDFLIREITKDLFKYLVGYKLPEAIQNRLRDLMGTPLIREKYQTLYTLMPQSDKHVVLDVKYQFELKNVSTTIKSYEPRIELEKHDNPRILELRCDQKDVQFLKIAPAGGTIGVESSSVPGVIVAVGETIDLLPQVIYPVSGHYQLRVPSCHSDTLSFLHPTVDVTVRAEYPDDFQFVIEGASLATPKMWQFGGRAFLTSEHIRIRWFKTNLP
jgi:hypothetical protein